MAVFIKGMAMPKNCRKCLFEDQYDDYNCCRINGKSYNWGLVERPSDCPLVEVPDRVTETNVFDIVEEHENCHVQVLVNSVTGETSIGWWHEAEEDGE